MDGVDGFDGGYDVPMVCLGYALDMLRMVVLVGGVVVPVVVAVL